MLVVSRVDPQAVLGDERSDDIARPTLPCKKQTRFCFLDVRGGANP
ncbi:MAG: hypothetical protein WAO20_23090 [Acidobacteriota bacterium]